ncbi:MAG TPA: hypothetical protein VFJ85_06965 [Acidimicrobiales bacterium]|nr:hypothetical protein [Acidimicrobiales bacterium]
MTRFLRAVLAAGAGAAMVAASACSSGTVVISSVPRAGSVAVYRITARAVTTTRIGQAKPERRVTTSVVTARHRVLEASAAGTLVEVRLTGAAAEPVTLTVRFDRAAQRTSVERADGLPAGVLGDVGLSELLPAAAAAPPRRALAPGDRWRIDGPVALAGPEPASLSGRGRLTALGVAGGRHLAKVDSAYSLPVHRTSDTGQGRVVLDGTLATSARVAYDLDDDEVHSVTASTTGTYALTVLPPAGVDGGPVPGTLEVDVTSSSRRVG